jgi:hypothetical protein
MTRDHLYSLVFAVCIGLLLSASGLLDAWVLP